MKTDINLKKITILYSCGLIDIFENLKLNKTIMFNEKDIIILKDNKKTIILLNSLNKYIIEKI